jgi:hypothetical protein
MNMPDKPKVTVTFARQTCEDCDPDISRLDQTDAQMGAGFEAESAKRKAAYRRGDWHMIGIRAEAAITVCYGQYSTLYTLTSPGLWGIESDSHEDYLQSVYQEECAQLRADIEAMGAATFA